MHGDPGFFRGEQLLPLPQSIFFSTKMAIWYHLLLLDFSPGDLKGGDFGKGRKIPLLPYAYRLQKLVHLQGTK